MTLQNFERLELDNVVGFVNCPEMNESHHARHSLAQIASFTRTSDEKPFVVVNTHIFWNPTVTDVKLFQIYFLTHQVARFQSDFLLAANAPTFLGGDLNSTPASAIYALLKTKSVSPDHSDYVSFLLPRYPKFLEENSGFHIPQCWTSVVEGYFTNYVEHFRAQIDYILYNCGEKDVVTVVDSCVLHPGDEVGEPEAYKRISAEDFDVVGCDAKTLPTARYPLLPSSRWPSDHLAVKAIFRF